MLGNDVIASNWAEDVTRDVNITYVMVPCRLRKENKGRVTVPVCWRSLNIVRGIATVWSCSANSGVDPMTVNRRQVNIVPLFK